MYVLCLLCRNHLGRRLFELERRFRASVDQIVEELERRQLSRMRLGRWAALMVFIAVVGSFGSCVLAERRAETRAKAFCSRFVVGGDFKEAIGAANAVTDAQKGTFETDGEQTVFVSYSGAPPFSRHVCSINGVDGKITHVRYEHLD